MEDTILPLRTSTTVSIVSSKLRKPNQRFDFLKFTLLGALPDYFHTNQCLFRRGALRAPVGINVTTVGAHRVCTLINQNGNNGRIISSPTNNDFSLVVCTLCICAQMLFINFIFVLISLSCSELDEQHSIIGLNGCFVR